MSARRRAVAALFCALALAAAWSCGARSPAAPTLTPQPLRSVPILGAARLTGPQLAAWFWKRHPDGAIVYTATEPLEVLTEYFVQEGAAEGVAGDVAFVQAIYETGWFRFQGAVPGWKNNFAGIGAIDSSPGQAASFPDARTGIRAQIQHLRAYADPTAYACSVPPLHNPCVDPRFDLVVPKGKAATWNQLGNGNWATSPTYGSDIVQLYGEVLASYAVAGSFPP